MAAWSNAVAAPAPARPRKKVERRPQEAPAARPRATARPRGHARRLRGGILWIVGVAGLLAGVVALNVAVLQLNMRVDKLDRERTQLQAQNQALQSQLASAAAAHRIQERAARLGLQPASAQDTTFVQLTPGR
jgi:cell division protein FtsL